MKLEWWILVSSLVLLSVGYILLQVGHPIRFDFLQSFIWPVVFILAGDVLGPWLDRMFPFLTRLSFGHSNPGLYLRLLGWLMLYGGFVVKLVMQWAQRGGGAITV